MSNLTNIINQHLCERVQNNELTNKDIVSIIDNIGAYLNLQTFSDYAKREGITYNGVLSRIKDGKVAVHELFGVKFVIDNH